MSEGFGDDVLRSELQNHGIPGSHTEERTGDRIGVAFAAWDKRVPANAFYNFLMRYRG